MVRCSLSSVTRFRTTIRVGVCLQYIPFNKKFLFGHLFLPRRCIGKPYTHSLTPSDFVEPVVSLEEAPFMQTASMSSIIAVGCHVSRLRRSSTLGARPRISFATRLPNRNTSRLLGRGTVCVNWASEPCGRIGTESPDPLVRTCLFDVAQFSAWCCDVLRCCALLHRLLQHLRVRCDVRQSVRGCSVVRSLASCSL